MEPQRYEIYICFTNIKIMNTRLKHLYIHAFILETMSLEITLKTIHFLYKIKNKKSYISKDAFFWD